MAWIFLVITAQFTWALGNYIDHWLLVRYKVQAESNTSVGTLVLVSGFFAIVIGVSVLSTVHLLSFHGVIDAGLLELGHKERLTAMLVGVLEILWLIPYLYALDESDETQAPPLFQTVPIFGIILGILFFDEIPAIIHIFAGGIILTGSVILNINIQTSRESGRLLVNVKVVGLMLLASLIIALAAFLFKGTALEENYWGTVFWMSVGGFLTACVLWIVVPVYRRQFNAFVARRDIKGFAINVANEITDNVAILAFYGAVMLGPSTALVQATVAYQPVFILLIGMMAVWLGSEFHAERLSGAGLVQRVVGISIIVLGSVLIFI
jgi:drug/metabolite transporter (DMT)-like permease